MTFTHAVSTDNYGPAKWVVDASAANGTHTTIASALTSSSSGDTIFVRPGTYTENLTLKAGVDIVSFGDEGNTPNVLIIGKLSASFAGICSISGLRLQTNSDNVIAITGSAATTIKLFNCYLNLSNNSGISVNSSGGAVLELVSCRGDLATTGIKLFDLSAGGINMNACTFSNSGSSLTASTQSSGIINLFHTTVNVPISLSSSAVVNMFCCFVDNSTINTACITTAGTGTSVMNVCEVSSGTASAISIGAGTTVNATNIKTISSNTNVITGAGTLNYSFITFAGSSSGHNVTVENAYATLI